MYHKLGTRFGRRSHEITGRALPSKLSGTVDARLS